MTKTTKRRRIFLETSGVVYELHGHSLMQAAVRDATGKGHVEVSNFVRMEYLRGMILNLTELYFLIKESDSVSDALIDWSQKVHQERKLKVALMTITSWITDQEHWQAREKSLRRLGDLIVRLVYTFDEHFQGRAKDQLECQLGRVNFPRQTFDEEMLLDFYERFKAIQHGIPKCHLCEFRARQQRRLNAKRIDLFSETQRKAFNSNKGYVKQAERVEQTAGTTETDPKCRWCERLGDSIIALHSPQTAVLVTADRAFVAFGQFLNRQVRLLPSLAELKRLLASRLEYPESNPESNQTLP